MRFMPHTDSDVASMLETIGAKHLDDLIAHVPANLRASATINLERGRSEADVVREISALAARNTGASGFVSFLGAGYYRHYVPAAVRAVIGRAEFATSYTPYQAEASQGTTQAIFEFQTLITQLTAMEVANASMYDGASAAAEAVLMARRLMPKRSVVALSRALWPDYRATIRTYLSALNGIEIVEVPFDDATGATDAAALDRIANDRLLCTVTGYPNAFGVIEPLGAITEITHRAGALAISATAEGIALGLLRAPGELGVDIAVGEGQSFGLPLQYGGPGRRLHGRANGAPAPDAGTTGRTDSRSRRPPRILPDARDSRAAYPPRTRDFEHLHQSFAVRARRDGLSLADGPHWTCANWPSATSNCRIRQRTRSRPPASVVASRDRSSMSSSLRARKPRGRSGSR